MNDRTQLKRNILAQIYVDAYQEYPRDYFYLGALENVLKRNKIDCAKVLDASARNDRQEKKIKESFN